MKNRTSISIILFISEIIIFVITRFIYIDMHKMYDFSEMMALVSGSLACLFILENRLLSATLSVYSNLLGFLIGLVFNHNYMDVNGISLNNMWIIWLISYIIVILLGMVIERLFHVKHR